jgi:hypothetical protein
MKGNSALEVMAAIVANGGPVEAWVKQYDDDDWSDEPVEVTGVDLDDIQYPFYTIGDGHGFCSLTNPHQQRKMRPMTPLEAYEFLAQGHEGKPRVWRIDDYDEETWYAFSNWSNLCGVQHRLYANLSDRDGDTLIWREFPMVEDN